MWNIVNIAHLTELLKENTEYTGYFWGIPFQQNSAKLFLQITWKTSILLRLWYPPPGKNFVVSYKDSWEDCSKYMCKLSETNIHWCWRYSSIRTKFSNILSIWDNKNGDKSAILNMILTKIHKIPGKIKVNACVKYRKPIFIGVGDIYQNRQHFQIFGQFEKTKMSISQPF